MEQWSASSECGIVTIWNLWSSLSHQSTIIQSASQPPLTNWIAVIRSWTINEPILTHRERAEICGTNVPRWWTPTCGTCDVRTIDAENLKTGTKHGWFFTCHVSLTQGKRGKLPITAITHPGTPISPAPLPLTKWKQWQPQQPDREAPLGRHPNHLRSAPFAASCVVHPQQMDHGDWC